MDAASRHRGTDSRSPLRLEGGRIRERFGPFLMAIEGKDTPFRSAPKKLNWERINQDQMSRHGIFSQSYLELCQGILLRMVASTQFGASCKRGSGGFRGEHMSRIVAGRGECSRELPDLLPSSNTLEIQPWVWLMKHRHTAMREGRRISTRELAELWTPQEPLVEGTTMAKVEPWRRTQKDLCGSEENLLRATAMG